MSKGLPKKNKLKVYIYPSSGRWMIRTEKEISPETLYTTANEALEAARDVFKNNGHDSEIIICNQNMDSVRLSA